MYYICVIMPSVHQIVNVHVHVHVRFVVYVMYR